MPLLNLALSLRERGVGEFYRCPSCVGTIARGQWVASSVPTAETFTPRAWGTQRQLVRKPEKVAWELEEIRSP